MSSYSSFKQVTEDTAHVYGSFQLPMTSPLAALTVNSSHLVTSAAVVSWSRANTNEKKPPHTCEPTLKSLNRMGLSHGCDHEYFRKNVKQEENKETGRQEAPGWLKLHYNNDCCQINYELSDFKCDLKFSFSVQHFIAIQNLVLK